MTYCNNTRTGSAIKLPVPEILLFWVVLATLLPNIILAFTEHMSPAQSATNILLPGGVYLLLMSLSSHICRSVLWMFPLTFLAAFEFVLLNIFKRSVIAVDMWLNLATTNSAEVGELLGNLLLPLIGVAILYAAPMAIALIGYKRDWRLNDGLLHMTRFISACILFAGAVTFAVSFYGQRRFRPLHDIFPVNAVTNCIMAFNRFEASERYPVTSSAYRHNATYEWKGSSDPVIIVVIGETSRADNWQLAGYNRPTNPRLSGLDGLFFYSHTFSESNTTHKSVPMLLSPVNAVTFADSLNHVKSLISAFGEAGYRTAFYSAQQRNHSYIDYMGKEADCCEFLIESTDVTDESGNRDKLLIQRVRSRLSSSTGPELMVLHTYGSHYKYTDRYPAASAIFKPDGPLDTGKDNRPVLINAYDNTIVRTDSVLSAIACELSATNRPGAIIYASDHGEDIYDDERGLFLHASPVPSYMQLHVPMLVWLSQAYRDTDTVLAANLAANCDKDVSSSRSMYHTALSLGKVCTTDYDDKASLTSASYTDAERLYLTDRNEAVTYTEAGFGPLDFNMLGSHQKSDCHSMTSPVCNHLLTLISR